MKLGQTVIVHNLPPSNGSTSHPAIVNAVWGPDMVNTTVFPDCGTPYCQTSVHRGDRDDGQPFFTPMYT